MFSQLIIVNQILNQVGQEAVETISDSDASALIANQLTLFLPDLLLKTDWNFAIVYREDSTPVVTDFSDEFQYTYQLPPDYGRMDRFYQMYTPYRIVDGYLLSDQTPVQYYYVANDVDYSVLPASFARALVMYVASKVAMVLTNNINLVGYLEDQYKDALDNALLLNDAERRVISAPNNDYDRVAYI